MMSEVVVDRQDPRMYVLEKLREQEVFIPEKYLQMLGLTPVEKVIEGLSPWAFLPTPERSIAHCSEVFGSAVLPFAQAVGEDLMACFFVTPFKSVDVVLLILGPMIKENESEQDFRATKIGSSMQQIFLKLLLIAIAWKMMID